MPVNQEHAAFIKKMTFFVLLGTMLTTLFVIIVDPYRIYSLVDRMGFNHVKPTPERYQEQIKVIGAKRLHANALILGNSRAEIGFDPDDAVFTTGQYVAYNLAIPGSGINTARRQLDQIRNSETHPKLIILGLDFLDFLVEPNRQDRAKAETKSTIEEHGHKWQFDAAFSLQSVADSFKTLRIQHKDDAETITPGGFNPLFEYRKYAREQGYYALFQQRAEENAKNYSRKKQYIVASATDDSRWLELRSILAAANAEHAQLEFVIYPYHAQILLMFEEVGLLPAFEQWKLQLAKELDGIKNQYPQSKNRLWDFSGYSVIQCETIPAKSDKLTETQWYWEAGHFKPTLGSLMLSRLFEKPGAPDVNNAFGYLLDPTNMAANKQRLLQERQTCLKRYPELLKNVGRLMQDKR